MKPDRSEDEEYNHLNHSVSYYVSRWNKRAIGVCSYLGPVEGNRATHLASGLSRNACLIAIPVGQKSVGPRQDGKNPTKAHYIRNRDR